MSTHLFVAIVYATLATGILAAVLHVAGVPTDVLLAESAALWSFTSCVLFIGLQEDSL